MAAVSMTLGLGQNGEARLHQRVMGVMRAAVSSGKDSRVQRDSSALGAWTKAAGAEQLGQVAW